MSLINIKDYEGSLVALEAMQNMFQIDLIIYLKSFGYGINIFPIMESTPKGMIEDSPNSHEIVIDRRIFIPEHVDKQKEFDELSASNLKVKKIIGYESSNKTELHIDEKTKTTWFVNEIKIKINRHKNESNSEYALRIAQMVTNHLI